MSRLLILGGSDAGITAALRAREIDARTEVTVVLADRFPNYSVCGLPFYVSGEVPDWHWLAHRTTEDIRRQGVRLLLEHMAQVIDPINHVVTVADSHEQTSQVPYDQLIIATGAVPARPPIPGLELPGVYFLRSMEDGLAVHAHLDTHAPRSAVIVGGGYIGVEMADAFVRSGLAVTVVERGASVLTTVDESLGTLVGAELRHHGVEIVTGVTVERITPAGTQLRVMGSEGFQAIADLVLLAVSVQPQTELARAVGVATGERQAIRVSRTMETNLPDIYAAGDCVETWHRLLHRPTYLPLGTTAHKQGRIAGENAVGGRRLFAGTVGTQVVKVFDLTVARTGLREREARAAGFDPLTVAGTYWGHKVYYPGAQAVHMRLTGDRVTGRLLGAQMVGPLPTQVAKRIDILATALFHSMSVEELCDLDLAYTPPLGSPWDVVQMCAQDWTGRVADGDNRHDA